MIDALLIINTNIEEVGQRAFKLLIISDKKNRAFITEAR